MRLLLEIFASGEIYGVGGALVLIPLGGIYDYEHPTHLVSIKLRTPGRQFPN